MFKTAKMVDTLSLSLGVRADVTLTLTDTLLLRGNSVSATSDSLKAGHPTGLASHAISRRAFSLVEILVTVALLSFIILGLVAMFNQTRRAFTSSITQVDVLEAGRSAADIVTREMEQMATASAYNAYNFYVDSPTESVGLPSLKQSLIDTNDFRTNLIQEVFFLTRSNQLWTTVGYKVFAATNGIGALYRYSYSTNVSPTNVAALANQSSYFINAFTPSANFSRLIEGVVDFRIRAYDVNGNQFLATNSPLHTVQVQTNVLTGEYFYSVFTSNSLPAYVEVELGILEDRALSRYRSLTNGNDASGSPAWTYLSNHVGQVHIFRQRVSIRNVNPAAYQ